MTFNIMKATPFLAITSLALSVVACDETKTTAALPSDGGATSTPLYAVATQVIGPTSTTYVAVVDDIDTPRQVGLEGALEVPGRAIAVGRTGGGAFFTGSAEGPELRRYEVGADRKITPGATLSFASYGVSAIFAYPQQIIVLSDTKAYYLDDTTLQIFVWNPSTMTIDKTIPLASLARAGWQLTFGISAVLRGNELVFTTSYFKEAEEKFDKETPITFVDTVTDAVLATVVENRCSYLANSMLTSTGDIILSSEVYTAAVERTTGASNGGPSCAVKIPSGQRATDPAFFIDFKARTGGDAAGSLFPGGGTTAFFRRLDSATVPTDKPLAPRELFGGAYWRWAKLDLASSAPAEAIAELPLGPSSILAYPLGDRVLTNESTADYSSTTILDIAAAGGPKRGLTIKGVPFSIVRVR